MELTRVALADLHFDPENARQHGSRNLETIHGSLQAFGQVENLVVQKSRMRIIGGNGRVKAMKKNGDTHAHVLLLDIDDMQAKKLGLALNRTAELAEWDKGNLSAVTAALHEVGIDTSDIGFSDKELADICKLDIEPEDTGPGPDPTFESTYAIMVTCRDEEQQTELLETFTLQGLQVKALIS